MKILTGGLLKGGWLDRFRLRPVSDRPDNLENAGRMWFDTDGGGRVAFSYEELSIIKKAFLVDNRLKWVDMTSEINLGSVNGNLSPTWSSMIGGIEAMRFDGSKLNVFQSKYHFNHHYALNTPVYPHIHWAPVDPLDTGTVRWGFELTIAKGHQQEVFQEPIVLYIEQAAQGAGLMHMVAEVVDGWWDPSMEPDTVIIARIFRDGTHPNDTAGDVFGLMADIHHLIDDTGTVNKAPNFYG